MLRIGLFLLTNIAILVVASIILKLLGIDSPTNATGGLNYGSLLAMCAVFGFAGSIISLLISKWMAKKTMNVQIIERPRNADEQWLLSMVEELAQKAGIKTPEVGIFPAQEANAFATGWNRNAALVAVSLGMLQRFERDEVRAVMAHEIGHVANGDMVTLSLLQGVVNTFVMFFARIIGNVVDRVVLKNEEGQGIGYFVTVIFAQIVLGFLASMIVMAFSRHREFRADHAGATLGDRGAMIRALQRLQSEVAGHAESPMPEGMKAFGISGGFTQKFGKLFASHPPLEERIEALRRG